MNGVYSSLDLIKSFYYSILGCSASIHVFCKSIPHSNSNMMQLLGILGMVQPFLECFLSWSKFYLFLERLRETRFAIIISVPCILFEIWNFYQRKYTRRTCFEIARWMVKKPATGHHFSDTRYQNSMTFRQVAFVVFQLLKFLSLQLFFSTKS